MLALEYCLHNFINKIRGKLKIIILLKGGLGNQLYQYYAAKGLAETHNAQLIISCAFLPKYQDEFKGISRWPIEIRPLLQLEKIMKSPRQPKNRTSILSKIISTAFINKERINNFIPALFLLDDAYYSSSSKFMKHNIVIMNGIFGANAHLLIRRSEIRQSIIRSVEPEMLDQPSDIDKRNLSSLGIHIRLGDHLRLGAINLEKARRYLQIALSRVNIDSIGQINLFSDNIEAALTCFPNDRFLLKKIRVDYQKLSPLETLVTLSKNDILIGGRSTFFWWATFIQQESGISFLPESWRGIRLPSHRFLPENAPLAF